MFLFFLKKQPFAPGTALRIQQEYSELMKEYVGGYKFSFDSPNDCFGVDTELLSRALVQLRLLWKQFAHGAKQLVPSEGWML